MTRRSLPISSPWPVVQTRLRAPSIVQALRCLTPILVVAGLGGCVRPAATPSLPATPQAAPVDPATELAGAFLAFHLYFNPVEATLLGTSDYDARMPDWSPGGTDARIAAYRDWLGRVRAVDVRAASLDAEMDIRVAERTIRLVMAEAEDVRPWETNPLLHVRTLRQALEPFLTSGTLTDAERLVALTARQRQVPNLLAEARATLDTPPRILTVQAIRELEGTLDWLRRDLPSRFSGAPEADPKWGFERSNPATVAEVEAYLDFLRNDLLPRSDGDLGLGGAITDRILAASGVAPSSASLLEEIENALPLLSTQVQAEAGRLGPEAPEQILARVDAQRLPGDSVMPVAGALLQEVREFVERRQLLPLPPSDPRVVPVPLTRPALAVELVQAGRLASGGAPPLLFLDPLGGGAPVTRETLEAGVLREGIPGRSVHHFTGTWVGRPIRLALPSPGEAEGWGLQAAGLVLDQGFRGGDPLLRIAQLRDQVRALARIRAGLRLHRGDWTLDDAVRETATTTGYTPDQARRLVEWNVHDPLEGLSGVHALRYAALRDDLLERPLQAGGPLTLDTALTVILASGLSPDLARALLLPPPPME